MQNKKLYGMLLWYVCGMFFGGISCGPRRGAVQDSVQKTPVISSERRIKRIIRRTRVRAAEGFSQDSAIQDEQKYLDFLKGAVVPDEDWTRIQGNQLYPIYSLDQLEGAYFGEFLSKASGTRDHMYVEFDINHDKYLPKHDVRLQGAIQGQAKTKFYVGEFFGSGGDSAEAAKAKAVQNTTSDSVKIRNAYVRYAPSKRLFDGILSGKRIKDLGIKKEDFLVSELGNDAVSSFVSATLGVVCAASPFMSGAENSWEPAGDAGIPINFVHVFMKMENLPDRLRVRDLIKLELEKCSVTDYSKSGGDSLRITVGQDLGGYHGPKDVYDFIPDRPMDPTIPTNSTFFKTELENRAYCFLFPYGSEMRKKLPNQSSDSYPLVTKENSLEENFSVAVVPLLILGKTISSDGKEKLHVRYAPTAVRTFPAKWMVVDQSILKMYIPYRDPLDSAKSMVIGSKKLMPGVFIEQVGPAKELGAYEILDKMRDLKRLATTIGMKDVKIPDDVGVTAYEQILYRGISDLFLYLGKNSGAKTISLMKVQ